MIGRLSHEICTSGVNGAVLREREEFPPTIHDFGCADFPVMSRAVPEATIVPSNASPICVGGPPPKPMPPSSWPSGPTRMTLPDPGIVLVPSNQIFSLSSITTK